MVTQLSWTNNLLILSGAKTKEERHFYLKLSIKNNYSKRELDRQISSAYYERYMIYEYKLKLIDKKLLETKLKEMKTLITNDNIID